jgi:hypothetical protein
MDRMIQRGEQWGGEKNLINKGSQEAGPRQKKIKQNKIKKQKR